VAHAGHINATIGGVILIYTLRSNNMLRTKSTLHRAIVTLVLLAASGTAWAAELSLLSAGAIEGGLVRLIEQFQRSSGHAVRVQYGTGPELAERLGAAESADVLIAPSAVMDRAIAAKKAIGDTRTTVGRVGIGIIVRDGAAIPDVASPNAVQRAFAAADTIVFNRGSSGLYIEKLLAQMGITDQVQSRIVQVADGEDVMRRITGGRGTEIGVAAISAIKLFKPGGIRYVGPLPSAIQNLTTYDAAVMSDTPEPGVAAAFLKFITTPAARQTFREAGVE
jgi:molybdate transport system substrate-binding protein